MNKMLRWLPAALAPVVVIGGALALPAVANGSTDLPDKSPQQVLELVQHSTADQFWGTVVQKSDLGLPELPSRGPGSQSSSNNVLDLLTGSHTAKVFADGPDRQRVEVFDSLAERDAIHNGSDVWLYDSKRQTAVHVTLPAKADAPDLGTTTPPDLARRIVAAVDPSTALSVGTDARVAGRPVYSLVLTPKSDTTLVGDVTISVDASTGLPLRVEVDARSQDSAAFDVGFRSIHYSAPDESTFRFAPPPDAQVTTASPSVPAEHPAFPHPTVTGSGWDSVVAVSLDAQSALEGAAPDQTRLLDQLTISVPEGRALQTSLITVLLTDDGRVLAGAVPLDALQAAAR